MSIDSQVGVHTIPQIVWGDVLGSLDRFHVIDDHSMAYLRFLDTSKRRERAVGPDSTVNYHPGDRWSPLIFSRRTSSLYHQIAVGRGKFNDRSKYHGRSNSSKCRFGCDEVETAHHIFLHCPRCSDDLNDLKRICESHNLDFDLPPLFTSKRLQIGVELVLNKLFPDDAVVF